MPDICYVTISRLHNSSYSCPFLIFLYLSLSFRVIGIEVIAEPVIERDFMSLQTRWQQFLKRIFKRFKRVKVILLTFLFVILSNLIVKPTPAQAGNFNFDGSVIEINQEFVGSNNQNKNDIDEVDVLIGVIIGSTLVISGSAYFIWDSVSHITKLIQGQVPEKTSDAALVESNN